MIYIVRHGQTDWNLAGKIQGHTNISLNKKGIKQAKKVSKKLKKVDFDIVFSSPLIRAYETASIITNKDIIKDKRLAERYYGTMEGKVRAEVRHLIDFYSNDDNKYNIENFSDFRQRINSFFDEIKEKHKGKNILIITHAGVSRFARCYFEGDPEDGNFFKYYLKNGEFLKYEN